MVKIHLIQQEFKMANTGVTYVGFFGAYYTWSIILMFLFEELQNALGKSEKKEKGVKGRRDLSG